MARDLKNIFDSITPENIKDVPLIEDAMSIFIESLEELSKESIDVKNVYSNEIIREELIKIYLDDLYRVFKNIQLNQKIIDRIDSLNGIYGNNDQYFNKDAILNMASYLNDEHFMTIKAFKESKGTEKAIEYMYSLISVFVSPSDNGESFQLIENDVFDYTIRGELPEEFYNYIVAPLAHPLGFTYTYEQYLSLVLEDFFPGENISYDINALEVRCLFPDGTTKVTDFKYYYDENGNIIKDENGTPVQRVVVDVTVINDVGERRKKILFEDGTYLLQVSLINGRTNVYFMDENDETIKHFDQQCSIYFEYEFNYDTTLGEEFSSEDTKSTSDYFARLNSDAAAIYIGLEDDPTLDDIGEFFIGNQLDLFDIGFNLIRDRDGNNLIPSGMQGEEHGRKEHYFSPSETADLKVLLGKYEKDVDIFYNGEYLETQHIFYTDIINPSYQVVERVNSITKYQEQNIGNEDYLAHEHMIENIESLATYNQITLEPAYVGTHNFIDANGVNRGAFPGYMIIGGNYDFDRSQTEVEQVIGYDPFTNDGTFIGGYSDDQDYNEDLSQTVNPNESIIYFETNVDADSVNLQVETYDVFDCGVYRDGVLLEDNNISALS
ncbi:hypothetical protein Va1_286 [Vibrio phage Va1]|nr:hypothetical protein Va1_286 [Vibrio phage Va1]